MIYILPAKVQKMFFLKNIINEKCFFQRAKQNQIIEKAFYIKPQKLSTIWFCSFNLYYIDIIDIVKLSNVCPKTLIEEKACIALYFNL
jgi:hypothetical protein